MAPLMRFLVPGRLIDYNHVIYLLFLGPQVGQTILGMPMFVTVIVGRQLSVPSSWSMAPLMRFLAPGQLIDYNHDVITVLPGGDQRTNLNYSILPAFVWGTNVNYSIFTFAHFWIGVKARYSYYYIDSLYDLNVGRRNCVEVRSQPFVTTKLSHNVGAVARLHSLLHRETFFKSLPLNNVR